MKAFSTGRAAPEQVGSPDNSEHGFLNATPQFMRGIGY